jgi:nicotinamidase-related amidase
MPMTAEPHAYALIEADDSVLIVIDVQDAFLDKLPPLDGDRVLNRVCWLVKLAMWRGVPLVVTAEGAHEQPLARKLVDTLPVDTRVFDKHIFGLAHQPDILAAVQAAGRKTAVLVGLETDVCVMHSAIGLLELGYRVAVVTDATDSPEPGHELGLSRLQSAGAILINMKGLFYEWLRTLEAVQRFHEEMPEMRKLAGTVL